MLEAYRVLVPVMLTTTARDEVANSVYNSPTAQYNVAFAT